MEVRNSVLLAIFATAAAIFAVLAVRALLLARHQPGPTRVLLYLLSALAGVYSVGSVLLVLSNWATIGQVPPGIGSMVAGPIWLVFGVAAFTILLVVSARFIPIWRHLRRTDAIVEAMVPGARYDIAASELALTPREAEILGAMFDGAVSDEEIAQRLFVSRSTVSTHVTNLMHKTGAKTRRELLLIVSKAGR